MKKDHQFIFGPVSSRRLGQSLGIDLVPSKTCSLNCVYCESNVTTCLTKTRQLFFDTQKILDQIHQFLSTAATPIDFLTFSGAGEPTLASNIGKIIQYLKSHYPDIPVAVLTNGTLLYQKKVQQDLLQADVVIPSLDAVSPTVFQTINRPIPGLTTAQLIKGIREFRSRFTHTLILEIFIVPTVNDTQSELQKLQAAAHQIQPNLIHLNYLDRPGICSWITKATPDQLSQIATYFKPFPVETVPQRIKTTPSPSAPSSQPPHNIKNQILNLIKRRPCTVADLCAALQQPEQTIQTTLDILKKNHLIQTQKNAAGTFWGISIAPNTPDSTPLI